MTTKNARKSLMKSKPPARVLAVGTRSASLVADNEVADNDVEESLELLMAIADYHSAVSSLANLRRVEQDRFGYGTEDARNRQDRVAKTKATMEALSARDYYQANPQRKPNKQVSRGAQSTPDSQHL